MPRIKSLIICVVVTLVATTPFANAIDEEYFNEMRLMCGLSREEAHLWLRDKGELRSLLECSQKGTTGQGLDAVKNACRFSDILDVESLLIHKFNATYPITRDQLNQAARYCKSIENFDGAIETLKRECAYPSTRSSFHIALKGPKEATSECRKAGNIEEVIDLSLRPCEWNENTAYKYFALHGWEKFSENIRASCELYL